MAQQVREAFRWDQASRYLLRDRDRIFGREFVEPVKAMGVKQVLSGLRSPWHRAHVERLIGANRRECLDHTIVFDERSLQRRLSAYALYYHNWHTHLALDNDAPESMNTERWQRARLLRFAMRVVCTILTNEEPRKTVDLQACTG